MRAGVADFSVGGGSPGASPRAEPDPNFSLSVLINCCTIRGFGVACHSMVVFYPFRGVVVVGERTDQSVVERLEQMVTEIAAEYGAELVEVCHHRAGRYQTVRVLVDKDGGITVSECAKVARRLSADLDVSELVEGRYTLEVSSPGLDRPLKTPAEFRRKIGRKVALEYRGHDGNDCTIEGTIDRVDDAALTVGATTVDWSHVVEGKLVI